MPPLLRAAVIIAAIMAPVYLAVLGLSSLLDQQPSSTPPGGPPAGRVDVSLSNCTASSGTYTAQLRVTNNTSRTRNVVVTVEWTSSTGTRLATDTEYVNNLAAGQSALEEAAGFGVDNGATVRCSYQVR